MKVFFSIFALLLAVCVVSSSAFGQSSSASSSTSTGIASQKLDHSQEMVRRAMLGEDFGPEKSYPDSVAFLKVFKEFYPSVAPKESISKRVTEQFNRMYSIYKARGVDSAAAWHEVVKSMDTNQDQKLIFHAYRQIFSAKELAEYAKFMKTSTGKKVAENQLALGRMNGQTASYPMMVVGRAFATLDKHAPTGGPSRMQTRVGAPAPGMMSTQKPLLTPVPPPVNR